MSMVERVARALCEAAEEDWDASSNLETANGCEPQEARDYWRMLARAAIAAMREPTGSIMSAIADTSPGYTMAETRKRIWQAGIDAALNEE